MTVTIESHRHDSDAKGWTTLAGPAFVVAGIAFFVGGVTHPTDSGEGNKVLQLHEMLVDSGWYPSHAMLLAAMAFFAVGIQGFRRSPDLTSGIEHILKYAFVLTCLATVSMTLHLFAALGADDLADGEHSLISRLQTVNEAVVQAPWALAVAGLAVVGGLTRTFGSRLTIPFGLVGGVAFAMASATVPFTDTLDPLFKVGSLLAVWAVIVGVLAIRRQTPASLTNREPKR